MHISKVKDQHFLAILPRSETFINNYCVKIKFKYFILFCSLNNFYSSQFQADKTDIRFLD